ncbi:MAG: HAMP domain-containing sensor histidine kinase [Bacilli bacterium]|nr:HAMP domain-containing sensor histidine kinase [Bacilli bacterium]
MAYVIIVLVMLLFILFFLYIQLRSDVKEIEKQLRYRREEQSSFQFFTTSSDKIMKAIVTEVNIMREENQHNRCNYLDSKRQMQNMIANISHDIRTPLTSIQGYVEMMQSSNQWDERIRYYKVITNRLHDLEIMLDEFFVYTKLMSTNEELVLESKAIYPIVCKSLLSYIDLLKTYDLEPSVICEDENICAAIHEDSLHRICMNLIINTIRYGKKPYHILLKREGEHIAIIFENECRKGIEIDTKYIFDRFCKGNQVKTQNSSGLGLAIVAELTQRMHGSAEAELKENILSIKISLPRIDNHI